MDLKDKILDLLNIIFWVIILIIFLNELYQFFEPKIVNEYKDKQLVSDPNIINELTECATIYFDTINFKQYERSNMLNAYLNRKTESEYNDIYSKINTDASYKLVIKYAYRLLDETYRCYVFVQDLSTEKDGFITSENKEKMYEMIIKLDIKNTTFKILHDKFI